MYDLTLFFYNAIGSYLIFFNVRMWDKWLHIILYNAILTANTEHPTSADQPERQEWGLQTVYAGAVSLPGHSFVWCHQPHGGQRAGRLWHQNHSACQVCCHQPSVAVFVPVHVWQADKQMYCFQLSEFSPLEWIRKWYSFTHWLALFYQC